MALRKILKFGDNTLRKRSREVEKFDKRLHQLLDDMAETLKGVGVGLAAPQVGILKRVFIIDDTDGSGIREFINPVIISAEGEIERVEGCLSYPGKYGLVNRPLTVAAEAFDRNGKPFRYTGTEIMAQALCHEMEHLDGALFIDKVVRMLEDDEVEK